MATSKPPTFEPPVEISSKLTSKYQATIPLRVRQVLSLKSGDEIQFDLLEGEVVLRKKNPVRHYDEAYLSDVERGLAEWTSAEDNALFNQL